MLQKNILRPIIFCLSIICILVCYTFPNEYYHMHGHSGYIEFLDRIENTDGYYKGHGMEFVSKKSWNWLHWSFEVPQGNYSKVDQLRFRIRTGSSRTAFKIIDLWNGNQKVASYRVNWSGSTQTYVLNLNSAIHFYDGLGISIYVSSSGNNYNERRVNVYNVTAHFVN